MAVKRLKRTRSGRFATGPQIIDQFTDAEVLAISSSGDTSALRWYMKALSTDELIDLDSLATNDGIAALAAAGILAPERVAEIATALKTRPA